MSEIENALDLEVERLIKKMTQEISDYSSDNLWVRSYGDNSRVISYDDTGLGTDMRLIAVFKARPVLRGIVVQVIDEPLEARKALRKLVLGARAQRKCKNVGNGVTYHSRIGEE